MKLKLKSLRSNVPIINVNFINNTKQIRKSLKKNIKSVKRLLNFYKREEDGVTCSNYSISHSWTYKR